MSRTFTAPTSLAIPTGDTPFPESVGVPIVSFGDDNGKKFTMIVQLLACDLSVTTVGKRADIVPVFIRHGRVPRPMRKSPYDADVTGKLVAWAIALFKYAQDRIDTLEAVSNAVRDAVLAGKDSIAAPEETRETVTVDLPEFPQAVAWPFDGPAPEAELDERVLSTVHFYVDGKKIGTAIDDGAVLTSGIRRSQEDRDKLLAWMRAERPHAAAVEVFVGHFNDELIRALGSLK